MKSKPMRIKASWGLYGTNVHRAGKNLQCGGENGSWNTAAYHLLNLLEREGYKGEIEFYGPCADELRTNYEEYEKIK